MHNESQQYFNKVTETLKKFNHATLEKAVMMILNTREKNGTIVFFGNGGSAANASHFCGDMVKGLSFLGQKRFKAICLNDNIPAMMAIANDINYQEVFREQLINFVTPNDLIIGISGSGNSENVIKAMEYAKSAGASTIAMCGFNGGKIKQIADLSLHADIKDMEISEDIHLLLFHCIKQMIINRLNGSKTHD